MKKLLLPLFLIGCLFGLNSKNIVKTTVFEQKNPSISRVTRLNNVDNFVHYWLNDFRVNNPAVCDITKPVFEDMYYNHYLVLSAEERKELNDIEDVEKGYTIGSVIKTLINRFYPNNKKVKSEKQKLDQSTIIVIATVVALVGATSISILYILKNNKVIK